MHTTTQLPQGYEQICFLDLQKDKKTAVLVNALGAVIMLVMGAAGHFIVPIQTMFDMSRGIGAYFLRFLVLLAGMVVYIVAHELTHAAVMKGYGAHKLRFGFTGVYAYAGSEEDYFDRHAYFRVALAPLVVWGVVFLVLNVVVSREWFWVVYMLQITNVSGAIGDMYVTALFRGMPEDILVRDTGVAMTVYSKER